MKKYRSLILILFLISCKEHSTKSLIGKWKIVYPQGQGTETNLTVEYTKSQYITTDIDSASTDTFDYTIKNDTIIGKLKESQYVDTTIIKRFPKDTILAKGTNGRYCYMIRQ